MSRKAAGVIRFMLLGIDRKSETDDETEDDEGDDEVEKARVLLFALQCAGGFAGADAGDWPGGGIPGAGGVYSG